MQTEVFEVNNVKCGGCAEIIREGLSGQIGVAAVDVDVAGGKVTVNGEALDRGGLTTKLAELGYPVKH